MTDQTPRTEAALAALDLLLRAVQVSEDETSWQEHAEAIQAALREGGLGLAIRREREFEATLDEPDYPLDEAYGPFPPSLAALEDSDD